MGVERKADVNKDGREVVYVNPVSMSLRKWVQYVRDVKGKLARGEAVSHLVCVSFCLFLTERQLTDTYLAGATAPTLSIT